MRIIILAGCILLTLCTHAQTCTLSTDTIFRQGQVDSFNINYSGCTKIAGNLVITGDVTNLDSLYGIRQISGTLSIINTQLKNCLGLYNLDTMYGFRCINNPVLKNLYGLESLTFAGALYIENNVVLEEIHSISSTDFTDFFLYGCPKILVVLGFNAPILLSNIVIENNDGIIAIDAFNAAVVVNGRFRVHSNYNLLTLAIGNKLRVVNGALEVINLENLIELPPFDLLEIVHRLTLVNLNNISTLPNFTKLKLIKDDLHISNNDNLSKISTFSSLKCIGGALSIGVNRSLIDIEGFIALDTVNETLKVLHCNELDKISGFKNLKYIRQDFLLSGILNLSEIIGFSSLKKVGREVNFNFLGKIKDLNAFKNLESGETLRISSCWLLDDISGITGIDFNKIKNLHLSGNDSLSYCHYEPICQYLQTNKGSYYVGFNKSGCNSAQEILEACRTVGADDLPEKVLTIYPNPTDSHFYIESDKEIEDDDIEIFAMTGSKVPFSRVGEAIYPHALDDGILIVKIKISGQTLVKKIIYLP